MNYRDIEPKDDPVIARKIVKAYNDSKSQKTWMKDLDEERFSETLYAIFSEDYIFAKVVEETFLVIYQLICPWYSDNVVYLEECLVLRLYNNPVKFDVVIDYFDEMAKLHGCRGIFVATDMAKDDKKLSEKYENGGFKKESIKLYKHIYKE